MSALAVGLFDLFGRIVIDRTVLGFYDFELQWTPDVNQSAGIFGGINRCTTPVRQRPYLQQYKNNSASSWNRPEGRWRFLWRIRSASRPKINELMEALWYPEVNTNPCRQRRKMRDNSERILTTFVIGVAGIALLIALNLRGAPVLAQTPADAVPDWQKVAGGRMAFEVASIKQGPLVDPSFPLDAGNPFKQTRGHFIASFPAFVFIGFAYKLNPPGPEQKDIMLARVPGWVTTTRFTIEARAPGNPTKDQFRLMRQAHLAERFHLAVHHETHEIPVYAEIGT